MGFETEGLSINITDLVIVGILLLSAVLAFFRGIVRELFAIAGWVAAAAATYYGFVHAQPYAAEFIEHPLIADVAAGAAIFLITLVVMTLLSVSVSRRVKASRLSSLDRSLGFLFGLARGALLVSITYVIITWAMQPEDQPSWLREAKALPLVEQGVELLILVIPPEAREDWAAAVAAAEAAAGDAIDKKTALEILMNPPPILENSEDPGYSKAERKELERLIESTQ